MENDRLIHWDLLRIISSFFVMLIHVSLSNWNNVQPITYEWNVFNIYCSISRFSVPIFIMISGMFMLDEKKNITIKIVFKNYLFHIVITFVFWSIIYSLFWGLYKYISNGYILNNDILLNVTKQLIIGRGHMWFLWMLGILYVLTPLLKPICTEKKITFYYIKLWTIFGILLYSMQNSFKIQIISIFTNLMNNYFVLGYVGYYILGYYLNRYPPLKNNRNIIYIFGAIGLFITIIGSKVISQSQGIAKTYFYDYLTPNVLATSLAIFVLFKNIESKVYFSKAISKIITKLSRLSYGAYLVHLLVMLTLEKITSVNTLSFNAVFSVPLITTCVFIISYIIVFLISKIPILKNIAL